MKRDVYKSGCLKDKDILVKFLKELLVEYDECVENLRANFHSQFAIVFKIHDDLSGDNLPGVKVESILEDVRAKDMAVGAFCKYKKWNQQNPKRTYRLPGVVVVDEMTLDIISNLNSYKRLIEDIVTDTSLIDVRKRGSFIKQHIHNNIVLKELYRKVVVVEQPVNHVSFTWGNNVPQSSLVSKKAVIEEIQHDIEQAEATSRVAFASELMKELSLVRRISPSAIFKKRRIVPPHPRANLTFVTPLLKRGKLVEVEQKHAYMPIILSSQNNPVGTFSIEGLKDSHEERRAIRLFANKGFELLIPRMNLYVSSS